MSLETVTSSGKEVTFYLREGNIFMIYKAGRKQCERFFEGKYFSKILKKQWQAYLKRGRNRMNINSVSFNIFPPFIGITNYYFSNAHGPQVGNRLPKIQEEFLYWLKHKITSIQVKSKRAKEDRRLQRLDMLLEDTIFSLLKNKSEGSKARTYQDI